jgi:hypothetical protein
MSEAISAFC